MRRLRTDWPGIKPPAGQPISPGHPLARGLAGYWLMPEAGHQLDNSVLLGHHTSNTAQATGTITPGVDTPYGRGTSFGSGCWYDLGIVSALQPPLPVTLFGIINPATIAGSTFNVIVGTGNNAGGSNYTGATLYFFQGAIRAIFGDNTGSYQLKSTSSAQLAVGTYAVCSCTIRGANDMSLYVNGIDQGGTYSGVGGAMVNGVDSVKIGAIPGNNGVNGSLVCAGIWNRHLSDAEHMALALDPFGVFSLPAENFTLQPPASGTIFPPYIAPTGGPFAPSLSGSPVAPLVGQAGGISVG